MKVSVLQSVNEIYRNFLITKQLTPEQRAILTRFVASAAKTMNKQIIEYEKLPKAIEPLILTTFRAMVSAPTPNLGVGLHPYTPKGSDEVKPRFYESPNKFSNAELVRTANYFYSFYDAENRGRIKREVVPKAEELNAEYEKKIEEVKSRLDKLGEYQDADEKKLRKIAKKIVDQRLFIAKYHSPNNDYITSDEIQAIRNLSIENEEVNTEKFYDALSGYTAMKVAASKIGGSRGKAITEFLEGVGVDDAKGNAVYRAARWYSKTHGRNVDLTDEYAERLYQEIVKRAEIRPKKRK